MKQLIAFGLVILTLVYIIHSKNTTISQLQSNRPSIDSITKVCDSLQMEILSKDIEVGRYEIIFDRAESEMSTECKTELENIKHTVE